MRSPIEPQRESKVFVCTLGIADEIKRPKKRVLTFRKINYPYSTELICFLRYVMM